VCRAAGPEPGPLGGGGPTFLCPMGEEEGHDAESGAIHRPAAAHESVPPSDDRAAAGERLLRPAMEWLDAAQRDVRGVYQDRRCRRCGFTVRVLLRELSDAAWIARLCVS